MKLTKHFTLEELTASDTALRLGIYNVPTGVVLDNLTLAARASSREPVPKPHAGR